MLTGDLDMMTATEPPKPSPTNPDCAFCGKKILDHEFVVTYTMLGRQGKLHHDCFTLMWRLAATMVQLRKEFNIAWERFL